MQARNVLGTPLMACSFDPLTGYLRDGSCQCEDDDGGQHWMCVRVTAEFLAFSRAKGNDLSAWRAGSKRCKAVWRPPWYWRPRMRARSNTSLWRCCVRMRTRTPWLDTDTMAGSGAVDEWFKSHAWKACVG
jgi:hypothetical protein